ncbi:MAG: ATP-binding cassette domain-containing protein [Fretibacterium sp.]|nr:ATP-binding cassette domain-containing protein [Fretibacterium sp.]
MPLLVDIEKSFGDFCLKVAFEAGRGTLALLGASGCGKSMTLRCIAGIIRPDQGRIVLDGVTLFDSERHIDLPPQERRCGLMFQNYALFPQMTVEQNLLAGARRTPRAERREKVKGMLGLFGLGELRGHYPDQLSGGQQQRVALARMLISAPRLLMLDEPFSALDSHLRFRMEQEVRRVTGAFDGPVLLVSHDRDEVFRMADRIAVVQDGEIDVIGDRHKVFRAPGTRAAAVLTGCKNISSIRRLPGGRALAEDWGVELSLPGPERDDVHFVGIRMHEVRPGDSGENAFVCRVVEVIENSFSFTVMLRPLEAAGENTPIGWELTKETWEGLRAEVVTVSLPPQALLQLTD